MAQEFAKLCEGKSGWLSPEGKLYPCRYGKHWEKANKLLKAVGINYSFAPEDKLKNQFQWVALGSSASMSYVSIATNDDGPCKYSEQQIKWLKRNYSKLDEEQQKYLNMYGQLSGWETIYDESNDKSSKGAIEPSPIKKKQDNLAQALADVIRNPFAMMEFGKVIMYYGDPRIKGKMLCVHAELQDDGKYDVFDMSFEDSLPAGAALRSNNYGFPVPK